MQKKSRLDGVIFHRGEYIKPMAFNGWFFKGGSTQNRWVLMDDFSQGGVHQTDGFWWVIFHRGEYTKPKGFFKKNFEFFYQRILGFKLKQMKHMNWKNYIKICQRYKTHWNAQKIQLPLRFFSCMQFFAGNFSIFFPAEPFRFSPTASGMIWSGNAAWGVATWSCIISTRSWASKDGKERVTSTFGPTKSPRTLSRVFWLLKCDNIGVLC